MYPSAPSFMKRTIFPSGDAEDNSSVLHIADNIFIRKDKESFRVIVKVARLFMHQEELICPCVYADAVSGACSD